jgi:N4-gp56 family major capsid protein
MAVKTYAVGDAETVKLWSKRLARESLKKTVCFPYFKESGDALGTINTDTQKGAGDRVTITLRMQMNGDGVTENETQEGNEEAIVTYTDNLLINELSHAGRGNKTISQQRVPFKIAREVNDGLSDWWSARMDTIFFNALCGYLPANTQAGSGLKYAGFNTVLAPSTGRVLRPSALTTDQLLTSTNLFTLDLIDKVKEVAETGGSGGLIPIRPISGLPAGAKYVMFLHTTQVTQLRTSTSTNGWMDIQKSLLQGGEGDESKIFKGGLGVWNEVLLVSSPRVTPGVNSTTSASQSSTRRAVFCGAQALGLGFGEGYGPEEWKWQEETFDYNRQFGASALNIFGIKKMQFNSSDFATIVVPTYAVDAA